MIKVGNEVLAIIQRCPLICRVVLYTNCSFEIWVPGRYTEVAINRVPLFWWQLPVIMYILYSSLMWLGGWYIVKLLAN